MTRDHDWTNDNANVKSKSVTWHVCHVNIGSHRIKAPRFTINALAEGMSKHSIIKQWKHWSCDNWPITGLETVWLKNFLFWWPRSVNALCSKATSNRCTLFFVIYKTKRVYCMSFFSIQLVWSGFPGRITAWTRTRIEPRWDWREPLVRIVADISALIWHSPCKNCKLSPLHWHWPHHHHTTYSS